MMSKLLNSLLRNKTAAAAIEFALIGPAFIAMFFGIMQVGIGMQQYNALRSISADTARYAVISYQKRNIIYQIDLQNYAKAIAKAPPYGLEVTDTNSSRFTVNVSQPVSRVTGATEFQITVGYKVRTLLGVIGLGEIPLTYTRPIFVMT